MASDDCSSENNNNNHNSKPFHVVIVGGGLAGLMAARQLLLSTSTSTVPLRITLVEAQSRLGGRLQADTTFLPGYPLDVGAEFIHCIDTLLTRTINEYQLAPSQAWEAYFVSAHADGGPDEHPTRDGKYGMYYCDGQLLMYNDPTLMPLSDALEDIVQDNSNNNNKNEALPPDASVADALAKYSLSPALQRLAVAGYGNTAGNTDMSKLSLSMLTRFERYWDENEVDGDYRLPKHLGMTAVIRALEQDLRKDDRLTIQLDWPVKTIQGNVGNTNDASIVMIQSVGGGETLMADAVICTAPPPLLPQLLPTLLTGAQRETLDYVGLETVAKVVLKFNQRPWPEHLQSVICADGGPLPEMWFRNDWVVKPQDNNDSEQTYHLMVGYLSSGLADGFMDQIQQMAKDENTSTNQAAAKLCLAQLSNILTMPVEELQTMHVDALVHAWNADTEPYTPGGYMYPKTGLITLKPLEEPCVGGRVFLAGEATNATNACCTMQAAMETGVRAAQQVVDLYRESNIGSQ